MTLFDQISEDIKSAMKARDMEPTTHWLMLMH